MTATLDSVLSRLEKVKKNGDGYKALCPVPAHEDHTPSLSVKMDGDTVLLHCFAGCKTEDVVKSMGMKMQDLMPEQTKTKKRIVAIYDYRDDDGTLLYQKLRYEPKDWSIRVPDGKGGWVWKLNGQKPVLYNLPALKSAPMLFVAEGEKDVETLRKHGYVGTTNYDGAGKWRQEYNEHFRDFAVFILYDNDEPGRAHAVKVFNELQGVAGQVRVITLPGLPYKGDVSDWFAAGGTVEEFQKLCCAAPENKLPDWADLLENSKKPEAKTDEPKVNRLRFINFADIQEEQLHWLWENRIPKDMLSMIVGNPNAGKTFVTCNIISAVTTGRNWPDGTVNPQKPGRVLFFGEEDSFSRIIKPRIRANGGNSSLVAGFECVEQDEKEDNFSVTEHLDLLEQTIDQYGDVALIVFDPITAYLRGINANDNADVRSAMIGLQRLAQKKGVTLLGLSHFSKKVDLEAIHRILGSTAFVAAARSVWAVVHEKTETIDRRVFAPVKSNYSIDVQGLAFTIIDGAVSWQADAVESDINQIMEKKGGMAKNEKVKEAIEWLRNELRYYSRPANEIKKAAHKAEISRYALEQAKLELSVETAKDGFGAAGVWQWRLPQDETEHDTKETY